LFEIKSGVFVGQNFVEHGGLHGCVRSGFDRVSNVKDYSFGGDVLRILLCDLLNEGHPAAGKTDLRTTPEPWFG
jgi:hypothetical protein